MFISPQVDSMLQTLGEKTITRFTLESAYTPTVIVNDPLKPGAPGSGTDAVGEAVLRWLKLKFTIDTAFGPQVIAPWGEPGPTHWPEVKQGLAIGGVALAVLLVWKFAK